MHERGKFRSRRFSKRVPEQEDPPSVNVSKSEEDGVVVSGNGKVLRDDAVVEELSEVVASEFVSDFVSDSVPILVYEDFAICFKISGEGSILIGDLSSVHQEVQVIGKGKVCSLKQKKKKNGSNLLEKRDAVRGLYLELIMVVRGLSS
ncbi:hypothetical protein ACOSQ3_013223 [Xanthoceras sorbifolium]